MCRSRPIWGKRSIVPSEGERVFVDARDGSLAWSYADLRTDAAVGLGTGVWGDRKKVSTESG